MEPRAAQLRQTGAQILVRDRPPSGASGRSTPGTSRELPPAPPSTGRFGRLHAGEGPELQPRASVAQNVPVLKHAPGRHLPGPPEQLPKAVWSDSVAHLVDEPWPAHAVPLFVFSGQDRPRPAYREEIRFTLRDERYINFGLRLRCGSGDRYMGGSIGLVHCPSRAEAEPGAAGQLATITDLVVQPDNSIIVSAVGDLGFRILRVWMPRGLRGFQLAFVEVEPDVPRLDSVLEMLISEPEFTSFAQLLRSAPGLVQELAGGVFTVFAPVNAAFAPLGLSESADVWAERGTDRIEALLRCHICSGRVLFEALYSGRMLKAIDGTILTVNFAHWPRGSPSVNGVPILHLDMICQSGVVHGIGGLLSPYPTMYTRYGR